MYYRTAEQWTHEAAAALNGLKGEGAQEEVTRKERRRRNSLVFCAINPFSRSHKNCCLLSVRRNNNKKSRKKHSREKRRSKLVGKEEEAEKAEEVEFGGREGRGPQKSWRNLIFKVKNRVRRRVIWKYNLYANILRPKTLFLYVLSLPAFFLRMFCFVRWLRSPWFGCCW